jgi:hypothetical protein
MPMVSKVTASDRWSVPGMVGAGRARGLSGGGGSRRWVSVLLRAVATGAVALGAVLGVAPSAAAEEGLVVESQNRYVVEDAGVRATTTLTIRNTSPDQYLTDSVVSFYWDESGIPVPASTRTSRRRARERRCRSRSSRPRTRAPPSPSRRSGP